MQPMVAASLLLIALSVAGCSDPPAAEAPDDPTTSSSSSSQSSSAASSTSTRPSSSSSSTAASGSSTSATASASATTTSNADEGSNATDGSAAAPTPVTLSCDLSGNGNLFEGPTATYRCATPDFVSDTGSPFTAIHVAATFEAPPSSPASGNTLTITNQQGEDLGSASGDSPLEFDLDTVPQASSFYLVAHLQVTVGPQAGPVGTASGTITFTAS